MIDPQDLAHGLKDLVDWATSSAPAPEPVIRQRLREHLGVDALKLPVVTSESLSFDRPNFQLALDRYLERDGRRSQLIGLAVMHGYRIGTAELAQADSLGRPEAPDPGPVEYEAVMVGSREVLCVRSGLWGRPSRWR